MAEANFESLNLEISVNAKAATEQVKALANAMKSLNRAMGKLDSSIVKKAFPKIAEQAERAARRVEKAMGRIENAQNGIVNGGAKSLGKGAIEDAAEDLTEQVRKMWGVMRNPHMGQVGRTSLGEQLASELKSSKGIIRDAADEVGRIAGESIREAIHNAVTRPVDRTEWFPASITGGNLGSGIISRSFSSEYATRSMQAAAFGKGITQSFSVAIQQTRAFTQVTKTLSTVTSVLSPTLKAAGVSVKAFGAAMSAAATPITAVVLAIQAAVKIAMFLVDQFNDFIETIKKFKKVLDGLNERFNPFVGLKKELGYLISLAKRQVLRRAINAAIKAITEGLRSGVDNLAQYDERFSATVQSFKNAMGLFKNSIGVAVAPIISYFIPAINQMLAALTAAMNTLARLTALLTGQHTYTVAKSYEDIGTSAGGASSKVKELQRTILGFDEINRLNRPSGSGGGGGGGAGDAISAYETLSVGDWPYDSWGEALLAFLEWLNGTGVPKLRDGLHKIAETVNNFTRNFYEAFTFDGVQEQIAQLGRNVASALNDFLVNGEGNGGINWTDLGNAVGTAIKSLFNFTGNFFRDFNFMGLGSRFAEAFNAALQQITTEDVNNIADTIFGILTSGIQVAIGFLMNANLGDLGFRAGEFLNRIIEGIEKLFGGSTGEKGGPYYSNLEIIANNVAKALVNFFDTVNWAQLFSTLTNIVTSIANGLQTIIKGLMQNKEFMNALRSFVEFVAKTAVQWFITKLKFYMGVGGGLNIWRMLASSVFGNEENPLYESFNINPNELNGFVDGLDEASDAIEGVGDASRTAATVTKTSAPVISNAVEQVAQNVSISGHNTVNAFRTMTTDSNKPLSDLASNVNTQFTSAKNSITNNLNASKTNAANAIESIRSTMASKMSQTKNNVASESEAMRSTMASKMAQMRSNAGSEAENTRANIVNKIAVAKSQIPAFNDVGANIKNGIIGGMGDFKGQLDQWASQFKNRILQNFKIKSPSKWAQEFVGEYISEGIALGMMDGSSVVEQACAGLKEGISSEFSDMSFMGNVSARASGLDIAGAIGNQVTAGIASMTTNGNQQPIVCEVYLDRDKIATAVTRGQQAQNRRYSSTAMAY